MTKQMAIGRPSSTSNKEIYLEIQTKFKFANTGNDKLCYIEPYVIITDGKDILVTENEKQLLNIGIQVSITNPLLGSDFASTIENNILYHIWNYFHIQQVTKDASDIRYRDVDNNLLKHPKRVDIELCRLQKEDASLHCSNNGILSFDKRKYHPVYFLIIPNRSTINLSPTDHNINYGPIEINTIINGSKLPMSFIATKTIDMLHSGDMYLPVISE